MSKNILDLIDVLTQIDDKKVMKNFLIDITTPAELKTLQERLNVAMLLEEDISYKEISQKTGSSTTTITRVARFLKDEKFGGYRWVIKNIFKTSSSLKTTKSKVEQTNVLISKNALKSKKSCKKNKRTK